MSELEGKEPTIEEWLHLNFLALQRIYDVLCTMLYDTNEAAAEGLMEMHDNLEYLGSFPFREEKNADSE